MENRKFRYDSPKQVKFIDLYNEEPEVFWLGGIVYGSDIICGCCGGVFEISDVYSEWDELKDLPQFQGVESPIVEYNYWADLRDAILGDDGK